MTDLASSDRKQRPEFRNINVFSDVTSYSLPPAGIVSILHRISGAILFVLMPFIIWMFDASISSEYSFARLTHVFSGGIGFVPGWFVKLVTLAIIWSYLHHFAAGIRHLMMDINHDAVTKEFGRSSALTVLAISLLLTAVLGAKLFDLY